MGFQAMFQINPSLIGAAFVAISTLAFSARAETYSFVRLTGVGRGLENEDLAAQLFVDVTPGGEGQVDFRFRNQVGIDSSITDIYFDDGSLLGIASITDSDGPLDEVAFSQFASPPNLPGGNDLDPPFEVTEGFSADSDPPVLPSGVNAASEWVTIRFDLLYGQSFQDTIDAIEDRSLRIGLHVQGIGDLGGSDSYLGNNLPIPEPTTALLVAGGLGILSGRRRGRG